MDRWETKRVSLDVTEIDLARLAAFIDGEGYICVAKYTTTQKNNGRVKTGYSVKVEVTNTDPQLMVWLKKFGVGYVWWKHEQPLRNRRIRYTWCVRSREAVELLKLLLPYFVMKKNQAELLLEFTADMNYSQRGKKGRMQPLPASLVEKRNAMVERLKAMRIPSQEVTIQ